jgi:hypothetical protein
VIFVCRSRLLWFWCDNAMRCAAAPRGHSTPLRCELDLFVALERSALARATSADGFDPLARIGGGGGGEVLEALEG